MIYLGILQESCELQKLSKPQMVDINVSIVSHALTENYFVLQNGKLES